MLVVKYTDMEYPGSQNASKDVKLKTPRELATMMPPVTYPEEAKQYASAESTEAKAKEEDSVNTTWP